MAKKESKTKEKAKSVAGKKRQIHLPLTISIKELERRDFQISLIAACRYVLKNDTNFGDSVIRYIGRNVSKLEPNILETLKGDINFTLDNKKFMCSVDRIKWEELVKVIDELQKK